MEIIIIPILARSVEGKEMAGDCRDIRVYVRPSCLSVCMYTMPQSSKPRIKFTVVLVQTKPVVNFLRKNRQKKPKRIDFIIVMIVRLSPLLSPALCFRRLSPT